MNKSVVLAKAKINAIDLYLNLSLAVVVFYFISPTIWYLMFWGQLPDVSITPVHGIFLFILLLGRVFLLLSGELPLLKGPLFWGYFLIVFITILQIIWWPVVADQYGTEAVLQTISTTIIATWLLWLGGEALAVLIKVQPKRSYITVSFVYAVLAVTILYGTWKGLSLNHRLVFAFYNPASKIMFNYFAVTDALAITGLILLTTLLNKKSVVGSLFFYCLTSVLLVFGYSRTSLVLFLAAGFLVFMMACTKTVHIKELFLTGCIFTGVLMVALPLLAFQLQTNTLELLQPTIERVASVFNLANDPSFQSRLAYLFEAINSPQNWFLGAFMNEFQKGKGTYVHSWLSFLFNYGVIPFIISLVIMVLSMLRVWYNWLCGSGLPIALGAFVFAVVAVFISRSYIWPFIWFALGLAAREEPVRLLKKKVV